MSDLNNIKTLSGSALVAGVMGCPVRHSKSPRLHGYWIAKHGVDGIYIPMAVDESHLEMALRSLPVLGFRGVNLTIPHKEKALQYIDIIDDLAQRVGAVNTVIVHEDGQLEGQNTDVFGFMQNLFHAGFSVSSTAPVATVLGAGGASRAIIVALQDMGVEDIRIVNRNQERASALVETLSGSTNFTIYGWDQTDIAMKGSGLLVNTTSLGMVGQPDIQIDLSYLSQQAWVTDIVYAPLETTLLRQAKSRQLKTVDGLGMLLHQARPGFEAWFGTAPDVTPELRNYVLGTL